MEVANPIAYYNMATITAVKRFIVQAPGAFVVTSHRSTSILVYYLRARLVYHSGTPL